MSTNSIREHAIEDLEEYGIRYNETTDNVEFRGPIDGVWSVMKNSDLILFAQDQIFQGIMTDLDGDGHFALMASGNHVYYENLTPEKVDEILDGLE